MATRKQRDAEPLPSEVQPSGSGAVPGSAEAAETFGERMQTSAAGEQVAPGVNDGAQAASSADEPMVYYTGEFGKREITAQQWTAAGIPDMPTVLWERHTGHKVPLSVFDDKALQVLRQDGNFRVSE